jgi:hypothetical protein
MIFNNRIKSLCILGLGLTLSTVSCKDNSKATTPKATDIPFTKEGTLQLVKAETDSIIVDLDIEIADDDYQIQTGLMYRNNLKANHGMLFIFPTEAYKSFYMKNTRIPLDIIYIDKDSAIVNIQKNAVPFDETSLPSSAPIQYVLEVNAGLSEQWGLESGDKIRFEISQ